MLMKDISSWTTNRCLLLSECRYVGTYISERTEVKASSDNKKTPQQRDIAGLSDSQRGQSVHSISTHSPAHLDIIGAFCPILLWYKCSVINF